MEEKMPSERIELSIPYGHRILSAARIPVPTQGQLRYYCTELVRLRYCQC